MLCAVGDFRTKSRVRGGGNITYGFKFHFYSLAVAAGVISDTGWVMGSFTKLNNGERG